MRSVILDDKESAGFGPGALASKLLDLASLAPHATPPAARATGSRPMASGRAAQRAPGARQAAAVTITIEPW